MTFLNKIRRTIASNKMLGKGDRVIAAVSGGPDSMCLLHVLKKLSAAVGFEIVAAHLNHNLRGAESNRDESFVRKSCLHLGINCRAGSADIKAIGKRDKVSLEEAGRVERYRFLNGLLKREAFNKIALGHHKDDLAETVLMNLLRGTGPDGLKGIDPVRGNLIRPLIDVSRSEIVAWLRESSVKYCIDGSNDNNTFRRNSIRNELLPKLIAEYNPSLPDALVRLASAARLDDEFFREIVERILAGWDN